MKRNSTYLLSKYLAFQSVSMYKIVISWNEPFIYYTTWNKMFCGKSIENRSSLPSICEIVLDEKLLWNVPKFYVGSKWK